MSSDWVSCHLDDFLEFANGKLSPERLDGGSYQVFGSNGAIGRCHESNAPPETTIIGRVGSYCGSIHYSKYSCWVTDNAIKSIPRRSHNARFCYYLLNSLNLWRLREGSGQPLINQSILGSIRVSLPPLIEQKAIAHILGTLDDKIELNRKTNETLEAIAKALFKSWFVDFDPVRAKAEGRPTGLPAEISDLFPDSFEESELGEIPRGWATNALDEIANFLNGLALQKFPPSGSATLPVIKIAQLNNGSSDGADRCSTNVPTNYVIQDGDILFSWSGSLVVVIWCGGKGALNQHLFKVTSSTFPKWFVFFWVTQHLPNFRLIAASKATTMGHIQRHHLKEAKVVYPPTNILQSIGSVIAPILDQILANRLQQNTLEQLRDTLLPKLISGELRVPDTEALVAEAGI